MAKKEYKEADYGQWGNRYEHVVYRDADFIIVRHKPCNTKTGKCYEVVPRRGRTHARLDDWEICPEPSTFKSAVKLMEKNRKMVRAYRRK